MERQKVIGYLFTLSLSKISHCTMFLFLIKLLVFSLHFNIVQIHMCEVNKGVVSYYSWP